MTAMQLRIWNEKGVALLTVLVFLVALALVGVAAMQMNTMEERMAGNTRDLNVAFQAAESGLRNGENDVNNNVITSSSPFNNACTNGLCLPPAYSTPWGLTNVWNSTATYRAYGSGTVATPLPAVSAQPKYIVEQLPKVPLVAGQSLVVGVNPPSNGTAYRITSWGVGGRPESQVVVQSVFVDAN